MEAYQKAKEMSAEIVKVLEDNHISTMAFGPAINVEYHEGSTIIPIFVVCSTFDSETAHKLADIAEVWTKRGFEGPYIAEKNDIEGMSDSVPEELLDVLMTYQVLDGEDVLAKVPKLSHEHLRAQAELVCRRYLFNLRWTLTQVLKDTERKRDYLHNVYLYTTSAIRAYHRITHPWVQDTDGHINQFLKDFPESRGSLKELVRCVRERAEPKMPFVDLVTGVMTDVLQPLLYKIDRMGETGDQQ